MPKFLFSYRVPKDYQPGSDTGRAWEAWFESLGASQIDPGHGVVATRMLGDLGADTRLGGYSMVTADNMDQAAALADGCPALRLGGGVEIGAVPEFIGNAPVGTDALRALTSDDRIRQWRAVAVQAAGDPPGHG
jgi:hypothetical protein